MGEYEVILDGGGPWGIRLQGGKDFGIPLNIAKVTVGSKAGSKGVMAGDMILQINGNDTTNLKHVEAQNLIKAAGNRLHLKLKAGKGASLGDIKQVGSGGFAASPSQTLYQTDVTHSAGVDHKFNSKPRAFGASATTSPGSAAPAKKFDPAEYARKKKEELDRYKEEQNKAVVEDSDVLKMLQRSSISGQGQADAGSFSRLQNQLANEGNWQDEEKAFRMTTNKDMSDISPGSKAIMDDIKNRGTSGLSSSGAASGGSKSFRYLQQLTDDDDEALPPPPPELIDGPQNNGPSVQSGTFNRMQRDIDAGRGDQVRTVFDAPRNQNQPRSTMPSGPNFKVGKPSAPTFKPMSQTFQANKPPPPPAVNAGEIQNPNSRMLSTGSYPSASPTSPTARSGFPPSSPNSYSQPAAPKNTTPQSPPAAPPASAGGENLICYACQRPLTGPFVSAIGKTWHPECFCCSSCNVSLQNQAFVEENNKLFCEKCYNQYYAPKCAHCNKAIIGSTAKSTDSICEECTSISSAKGIYDPIVCSQSINWLIEQIREANTIYERASIQKNDAMKRLTAARLLISECKKKIPETQLKIDKTEGEYEKIKQRAIFKQKIAAANTNIHQRQEQFADQILIVEKKLHEARNRLSSWKTKLAYVLEDYKEKCRRLDEIERRRTFSGQHINSLQQHLTDMIDAINKLSEKQELRDRKIPLLNEEIESLNEMMYDAETRSMLAEQHVSSLRTYKETIKEEVRQKQIAILDLKDRIELAKRKKRELMRKLNISHPLQIVR